MSLNITNSAQLPFTKLVVHFITRFWAICNLLQRDHCQKIRLGWPISVTKIIRCSISVCISICITFVYQRKTISYSSQFILFKFYSWVRFRKIDHHNCDIFDISIHMYISIHFCTRNKIYSINIQVWFTPFLGL